MSEQGDALNKALREGGVAVPPPPVVPPEAAEDPSLPWVLLPGPGHIDSDFHRELAAICKNNGVFLRSELPVALDPVTKKLKLMDALRFCSYVEKKCVPFKWKAQQGEEATRRKQSMSTEQAARCLRSDIFRGPQREILRQNLFPMPTLRADGQMQMLPVGYDAESKIYTQEGLEYDENMDLETAKRVLDDKISEFEFGDEGRSKAVHLAAWFTVYCLAMLSPRAVLPMFVYNANQPGAGKSLLAKMVLLSMFGSADPTVFEKKGEELRKVFDTEAIVGAPYIFFDNVATSLKHPLIDMWVTSASWKGRIMGTQEKFSVNKQNVIFVTVNMAETSKDIGRRALFVDLFVHDSELDNRKFTRVLNDDFFMKPEVRREIASALWTILKHWDASGRPGVTKLKSSFEEWSKIVPAVVNFITGSDCLAVPENIETNKEGSDMNVLLREMTRELMAPEQKGPKAFVMQDLCELCEAHDLFADKLKGIWKNDGTGTAERFIVDRGALVALGKIFSQYMGQRFPIKSSAEFPVSRMVDGKESDTIYVQFGRRGEDRHRRYVLSLA